MTPNEEMMTKMAELAADSVCERIIEEFGDLIHDAVGDAILNVAERDFSSWDDLQFDDFSLTAYNPHPMIKVGVN